ncbi:MAG TPA: ATP-binding protein [Leptospiraceae bacterium]|nr:ATP-binding protein [Leptospiraceae bacterium]
MKLSSKINQYILIKDLCSFLAFGIGVVAFIGWILNSKLLLSLNPSFKPMPPNGALASVLLGICLFFYDSSFHWVKKFLTIASIFLILISFFRMFEFVTEIDLGVDYLIFHFKNYGKWYNYAARTSFFGALCIFLGSIGILLLSANQRYKLSEYVSLFSGNIVAFIGTIFSLGYVYGVPLFYSHNLIPMSLNSAVSFCFAGIGISLCSLIPELKENLKTEVQLDEAKKQIESAFHYSASGMALIGINDSWIRVNEPFGNILGYTKDELISRQFYSLLEKDVVIDYILKFDDLLSGKVESLQMESKLEHKSGALVWALLSISLLRDKNNLPEYYIIQMQDITRLKKVETDLIHAKNILEDALQAKSHFFAAMSHELKTPLQSILGYSELIEEEANQLNATQIIDDSRKIHKSGKSLLKLINDILNIAKLDASKVEVNYHLFDLKTLLEELIDTIKPLLVANHNRFDLSVAEEIQYIYQDMEKLKHILLNLLSNACKFTTEGKISLSVQTKDIDSKKWLQIEVEDTGIGIPEEDLTRIFNPFEQSFAENTRKYSGTGLGLTIAKQFANLLGGDLSAESKLKEGSRFIVMLPLEESVNEGILDTI